MNYNRGFLAMVFLFFGNVFAAAPGPLSAEVIIDQSNFVECVRDLHCRFLAVYRNMIALYCNDEARRDKGRYTFADQQAFNKRFYLLLQEHRKLRVWACQVTRIITDQYRQDVSLLSSRLSSKDKLSNGYFVTLEALMCQEADDFARICDMAKGDRAALKAICASARIESIAEQGLSCTPVFCEIPDPRSIAAQVFNYCMRPLFNVFGAVGIVVEAIEIVLDPAIEVKVEF